MYADEGDFESFFFEDEKTGKEARQKIMLIKADVFIRVLFFMIIHNFTAVIMLCQKFKKFIVLCYN